MRGWLWAAAWCFLRRRAAAACRSIRRHSTHRRHRSCKRRRCALVVVFTTDRSAWFLNSRRVVGIRTDGEGRYTIRNLPSGAYHVALAPDLDLNEWYDPSVLQTLVPTALPLTISGPDKSTVDLAIR